MLPIGSLNLTAKRDIREQMIGHRFGPLEQRTTQCALDPPLMDQLAAFKATGLAWTGGYSPLLDRMIHPSKRD